MLFTDDQKELLRERRIAVVTTWSADGLPHMTAVWFLYEDPNLYLTTSSSTAKARNLAADARIGICIDARGAAGKERGVSIAGRAELLQGPEAAAITHRLHARYLAGHALDDPDLGGRLAAVDDLAIRVIPERVFGWDMSALDQQYFGGRLSAEGCMLPLDV